MTSAESDESLEGLSENDDRPGTEVRDKLRKNFIEQRTTESKVAEKFLKAAGWDLQKAIENFDKAKLRSMVKRGQVGSDTESTAPGPKRPRTSEENSNADSTSDQIASDKEDQDSRDDEVVNVSDSEDPLSGLPPVEVCIERCARFAEVTSTNQALAQFFLQDRDWDVERSIADYFSDLQERNGPVGPLAGSSSEVVILSSDDEQPCTSATVESSDSVDDLLKVISFNIDGLDQKNIELRTNSICDIVKRSQADVVLLQEVVPLTLALLESHLSSAFHVLHTGPGEYFTAILVHRRRMRLGESRVFDFHGSAMGRKLHVVEASFKKHKIFWLNTHLESTAEFTEQRTTQLKKCFRNMAKIPSEISVIFAGDLNLRDKELVAVGGIPSGVRDVWEASGARPEAKYTWDLTRNDNLLWNERFKPRCRFDRMYFRQSLEQPSKLNIHYFGLIGIERLLPHRCFPSDHWGLYAHFRLTK